MLPSENGTPLPEALLLCEIIYQPHVKHLQNDCSIKILWLQFHAHLPAWEPHNKTYF